MTLETIMNEELVRPRLHYNATANIPLKIYYVSSIETILCLHYNGVVCRANYGPGSTFATLNTNQCCQKFTRFSIVFTS